VLEQDFPDISKYYAANLSENLLTIGKISFVEDRYVFARDSIQGPFNLVADPNEDVTRMVQMVGEIHPANALKKIMDVEVKSCLYLCEDPYSREIEVRSIHNGMGTAIYQKGECPLILWNPKYADDNYFDVIDIKQVFSDSRLKDSFVGVISESLRELEYYEPLMHMKAP
jgi:hypothetical protein